MQASDSSFVKVHQPCWCGSGSDNTGVNSNGSAWCFGCDTGVRDYNKAMGKEKDYVPQEATISHKVTLMETNGAVLSDIPDRKLSYTTCSKYEVTVTKANDGITHHHYNYYDSEGNKVGTKSRRTADKKFFWAGNSKDAVLFGQNLFAKGGKYITLVEGELDALAAHQMTGNKWAVVSLKDGAASGARDIKKNLEYLESFETVVICFDMDEAGRKAAKQAAKLISPGKCKIMSLPDGYKDAADMLKANKAAEFTKCFWQADDYIPSGIMDVSKQLSEYKNRPNVEGIPYPWEGLNTKTFGLRKKELVTWTGGTGIGKTSLVRELEHHLIKNTKDKVGIMALEEDWHRTIDGIISIEANARLHIKQLRDKYPEHLIDEHFDKLFMGENEHRVFVHSHLGIQDFDDIISKLRYLIIGCDCSWVVLDHLQMLVSMHTGVDERQVIDDVMLKLRSLVEETGCGMLLVSHLKRTNNNIGHEQGLEVSLSHLRGSQSISQISDIVIAAERNQQAQDGSANKTQLRVLKNRPIGDTGIATALEYNSETGRMRETTLEDEEF
jgi:twinkle protein